ncbi:hypothetical protein NE237_015203 [Protea cynaroides]|uniref:Uncharacterized protein n=1 Tax=Protea cynaroides TaxID=273540 RepID=A0A9Q0QQT9_9MAGN|nr:hypothetical protein NE237_015203 [Protea cynaroides]
MELSVTDGQESTEIIKAIESLRLRSHATEKWEENQEREDKQRGSSAIRTSLRPNRRLTFEASGPISSNILAEDVVQPLFSVTCGRRACAAAKKMLTYNVPYQPTKLFHGFKDADADFHMNSRIQLFSVKWRRKGATVLSIKRGRKRCETHKRADVESG